MTEEPLARLEPFVHGDGTARDQLTRKQAIALHQQLMLRLPYVIASLRVEMQKDSVELGKGLRQDVEATGEWLAARSRLVPAVKPADPGPFWSDEPVLSVPTMCACCRVGLFFGECLRQQVPGVGWQLDTSNKRHMWYHYTVLQAPGSDEMLEPFNVTMNFVRKRLLDGFTGTLGDFFDTWADALSKH